MTDTGMTELERRCAFVLQNLDETWDNPSCGRSYEEIARAVLAEAGVAELVGALADAEQALISARAFILSKHGATNPSRNAAIARAQAAPAKIGAAEILAAEANERARVADDLQALEGYRAALAWIAADSWDEGTECIEVLRLARGADLGFNLDVNTVARTMQRLREHGAGK